MPILSLVKYLPWAVSGLMLVMALFYRGQYLHEQTLRAEDIAKAQKEILDQKIRNEALSREIIDGHIAEIAKLKEAYNDRVVSIMRAKDSNVCVGSPPVNAFLDGLRRDSKANPVQGKASKQSP